MAQMLDEKPEQLYDREESTKNLSDLGGEDIEKGISDLEKYANSSDGQYGDVGSKEEPVQKNSGENGGFYKSKSKKGGRFTRNQKLGLGGSGALLGVGGLIYISVIASGPLQIFQFANILQQFHLTNSSSLSEGRLSNFYRFVKYPDSPEQRRVGAIARSSAAKIEATFAKSGLTANWEGGRLTHLDVNSANVDSLRAVGIEVKDIGNGRYRVDIDPPGRGASPRAARANLAAVKNGLSALDVKVGAIGLRNLKTKAGIGFFDTSVKRTAQNIAAGKTTVDEEIDTREEYDAAVREDIKDGSYDTSRIDTTNSSEIDTTDPDATPPKETVELESGGGKVATRAKVEAARAAKGLAFAGMVCAAYQIADSASIVRQANVILPLMRVGMRTLTIASQIRTGEVTSSQLKYFVDDLYDVTAVAGARSWRDAAPIQANLGEPATGVDIPNSAHPTSGGNFILDAFNSIPSLVSSSIGSVCSVVSSKIGQGIGYAVDLFTGGTTAFVKGIAAEFVIGQYTDDLISLLAGEEIDTSLLKGGLLGAHSDYGMELVSQENMISMGGRKLEPQEVAELTDYYREELQNETNNKGFSERYFATNNPNSLFAKAAFNISSSLRPQALASGIHINPNIVSSIFKDSVSTLLVNRTYAETMTSFNYDIPKYGFSVSELENPAFQNPMENMEKISPQLEENKDKIEACFGLTLNGDGSLQSIKDSVKTINKERDEAGCDDKDETWTRIRLSVADEMVIGEAYACSENDEQACARLGISGESPAQQPTNSPSLSAPGLNGYVIPCTGLQTQATKLPGPRTDWTSIKDSGTIGTGSDGKPIKVYIRDACNTTNPRTVLIVSSIHGSENGGQLVGHELLFNRSIPSNVRIIVVPELNGTGISDFASGGTTRLNYYNNGRVNGNGVNLNRNNDYRWGSMDRVENTSTSGEFASNYRGPSPASEPETQAINSFILSLGNINLSFHYHDNLNYVGASGNSTWDGLAQIYASTAQMPWGNEFGRTIYQRGSLDGWQSEKTGKPVFLVELGSVQSTSVIERNVDAILKVLEVSP